MLYVKYGFKTKRDLNHNHNIANMMVYSLKILIGGDGVQLQTQKADITRLFFELLSNIGKQMSMFWDHSAFILPRAALVFPASLHSSWTTGAEHRNCDANGPLLWQKDTICLKNKSQFVATISSKLMFSLDYHHLHPKLHHLNQFSRHVNYLSPPTYLLGAWFALMGNFHIWEK